jgi:hypothetical protein
MGGLGEIPDLKPGRGGPTSQWMGRLPTSGKDAASIKG